MHRPSGASGSAAFLRRRIEALTQLRMEAFGCMINYIRRSQMADVARRSILLRLPIIALVAPGQAILAAESAVLVGEKRLALKGYDPVSYFTEGHPEKGSAEYQTVF